MKITILGRIPSKKNSKVIVCRGKFPQVLPSKNYQDWHKDASKQIVGSNKRSLCPEMIVMTLYAPDKRKGDLTNKAESVMDLLVDNGVLADDNWTCCPLIILQFGGVDIKNPRVEIELT